MRHRTAAVAVSVGALAAPGAAQAATLADVTGKPCYGTGDRFGLVGTAFTPNVGVTLSLNGMRIGDETADAAGAIGGVVTVPTVMPGQSMFTYSAVDQANPANTFALPVRVSPVTVRVRPPSGNPARLRRINAAGFTAGNKLYAHVVRGRSRRTIRLGRLRGPCKGRKARGRLFRAGRYRVGTYRVQFDVYRGFRRTRLQKVVFNVRIRRIFRRPPAAGAGARATGATGGGAFGETWTRIG